MGAAGSSSKERIAAYQIAEEGGLVTIRLASTTGRAPSAGVRLRLTPPRALLREDDHLLDTAAATPLVERAVAAAGVPWTDTIVGCGRVTVSFGATSRKGADAIVQRLSALDVKPWKIEQVLLAPENAKRLKRLRDEASAGEDPKPDTRLSKVLAGQASAGTGFLARCGLDTKKPSAAAVKDGLKWIHGELSRLEPFVLPALGRVPEGVRLGVSILTHPQQRRFDFALVGDEDDGGPIARGKALVLERVLGAPQEQTRRIAGILWKQGVTSIPRADRVEILADN